MDLIIIRKERCELKNMNHILNMSPTLNILNMSPTLDRVLL